MEGDRAKTSSLAPSTTTREEPGRLHTLNYPPQMPPPPWMAIAGVGWLLGFLYLPTAATGGWRKEEEEEEGEEVEGGKGRVAASCGGKVLWCYNLGTLATLVGGNERRRRRKKRRRRDSRGASVVNPVC